MKRTWARFEAVMKQGSEGEMAALPPGNPEGEKRGPGAVKRSTKLCSGESQSEKHDEARDHPRACGENYYGSSTYDSAEESPRVCGENVRSIIGRIPSAGSPPRMRGKLRIEADSVHDMRITPAYAGKTLRSVPAELWRADHPRTCGKN